MAFSVLFVCTGNICRSPLAERLMRARIDPSAPVKICSAGTMGLTGAPIDAPSARALRELGGSSDGHVAQRLTPDLVAAADLVLTADRNQRSTVVQSDPMSFRRVFTLREFGRLGAALPRRQSGVSLTARVAWVAEQRGVADPPEPGADDIADPFGASLAVARSCAAQIAGAVDATISILGIGPT